MHKSDLSTCFLHFCLFKNLLYFDNILSDIKAKLYKVYKEIFSLCSKTSAILFPLSFKSYTWPVSVCRTNVCRSPPPLVCLLQRNRHTKFTPSSKAISPLLSESQKCKESEGHWYLCSLHIFFIKCFLTVFFFFFKIGYSNGVRSSPNTWPRYFWLMWTWVCL